MTGDALAGARLVRLWGAKGGEASVFRSLLSEHLVCTDGVAGALPRVPRIERLEGRARPAGASVVPREPAAWLGQSLRQEGQGRFPVLASAGAAAGSGPMTSGNLAYPSPRQVPEQREERRLRALPGGEAEKIRVLMLTAYPGIAGPLPKLAPLMIEGMRALGCSVSQEYWSHRREHEGLPAKVLGRLRDLRRVRRRLRQEPFDVMLVTTTHDWPALLRDIPLLRFTRGSSTARVLHFHGSMVDLLFEPGHHMLKACSSWLVRHSDAVLVLSQEERDKWQAFSPGTRFEVVVNPFVSSSGNGSPPAQSSSGDPCLLFVGRLIPSKGIFDLLAALSMLDGKNPCRLVVAGQGPLEAEVRGEIERRSLSRRVDMVGYVEGQKLADLYGSATALVLPTYREGFPTVITEAMSHGLPVVTTRIRGAADLLVEGENAVFVEPRRPELLADAIRDLLEDTQLRERMAVANREKVKEFAPDRVIPRYVEIMASLLGKRKSAIDSTTVLGTHVDLPRIEDVRRLFTRWADAGAGRMVFAANVHMVMEGYDDPGFQATVNSADLVVPDGRPLVWMGKARGHREASQLRGLDLTLELCEVAERQGYAVGLYGGEPETNAALGRRLLELYPRLRIAYAYAPPFRTLTEMEDAAVVRDIDNAGVDLLFVGLGCPKQERWMTDHRARLSCVMVGVGAVFDMLAGSQRVAPRWMQRSGLEWAYRLALEPRRLWRRYARHNIRFVILAGLDWVGARTGRKRYLER